MAAKPYQLSSTPSMPCTRSHMCWHIPVSLLCAVLGGLDLELGFGFGVAETGVGMDRASASGSLRRLNFRIWYLAMGGGHAIGHDGKASDWTKWDDVKQMSNTKELIQQ